MRTSYSALDTYKTCPLKFKYQELDRIRVPRGVEAILGSTIHSALKYMFERSPLYPTIDEVIDFFRNKWEEKKDTIEDKEKEKAFYEEGIALLKKFYKANPPWNFNVVDLESRFGIDLEDPNTKEKHVLAGIIDRVDKNTDTGSYEIIDYKTAKKMPPQDILDQNLQMSIYHLSLAKRWPHISPKNIKLSFYFLKHGEKISTSRSEEQLEKTKEFVLKTINEIKAKMADNYNFPPIPSPLCDWCGYKEMCPMWKHLYAKSEARNPKSETEMEGIVKEYFELKEQNSGNTERLNELKAMIYGFMDDQKVERVFGNEGYITKSIQERHSYDLEKVREILEPIGKWNEILSADEKKLEEILPSFPCDIQQKILAARSAKQISTLTASRKKINKAEK